MASNLGRTLRLGGLIALYGAMAVGLAGIPAALLSIPDDCDSLLANGESQLRQWMAATFMTYLLAGYLSRHLLLERHLPSASAFPVRRPMAPFALSDAIVVGSLFLLTLVVPNAVIYFSAAPLLPLACAFGLTWLVRRTEGGRLELLHFLLGIEIALVMWLGGIHAGSLALHCVE